MKLIVGLGNPGPEYAHTRHNIGFMAADAIAQANGFSSWTKKFKGAYCEGKIGSEKVLLLKPLTYMNLSGDSAVAATQFFKIAVGDIIVLHDELDLLPGKLRVKRGGGAGGHNGLKSLDAHIGQDYWRVRIGIGHPGNKDLVSPYVLSGMPREEEVVQEKMIEAIVRNIGLMVAGDAEKFQSEVMNALTPPNAKRPPHPTLSHKGRGSSDSALPQGERGLQRAPKTLSPCGRGQGEGASQTIQNFAKSMRKEPTEAERMLWSRLRNAQLGYKFRRQETIGPYIPDFVCYEHKLIVELDGGQHGEDAHALKDKERDAFFIQQGYTVLRFWNNDALGNIDGVLENILHILEDKK